MDKTLKMSLLFDFYGPLLTQRQQDIYQLYFDDDLSLGEIADQLDISRQAVHDILKRSGSALAEFESKLNLLAKYQIHQDLLNQLYHELTEIQDTLVQCDLSEQAEKLCRMQARMKQILAES